MQAAFAELPLALFTTLASIGAGAFIALALAFATARFTDEQLKKIDKMTAIPVVIAIVGFICAAFHVANPLHAFHVFAGIGASPLTNELVVGIVFMVVAIIYLIVAMTGKLGGARKAFSIVVAILAVVFALFMGLAYMISTVPSWNNFLVPVQMVGYALLGGTAVAALVLASAKACDEEQASGFKTPLFGVAVVGAILAIAGLLIHAFMIASSGNAVTTGVGLLSGAAPLLVIGIVLLVIAAIELVRGLKKGMTTGIAARATVEAVIGVLAARLAFYALFLSIGVTML